MADLFISNVDTYLLKRFYSYINKLRPTGKAARGDVKKFVTEAIKEKLNAPIRDRGHFLLQKEIDELKAENIRLLNENVGLITDNSAQKNIIELIDGILHAKGRVFLIIPEGHAQEVFEILCAIPFEHRTFPADTEPQRHPAIESMIKQLKDRIEKENE